MLLCFSFLVPSLMHVLRFSVVKAHVLCFPVKAHVLCLPAKTRVLCFPVKAHVLNCFSC